MKTELQIITEETIEALVKAKSKSEMKNIWAEKWGLIRGVKAQQTGRTITTLSAANAVTEIRKEIKNRLDENKKTHAQKLKWLLYDPVMSMESKRVNLGIVVAGLEFSAKRERIKTDNFNESAEEHKEINNFNALRERIEAQIKSCGWTELCVMVAIVTGRRAIEILSTGVFTAPTKGRIKFQGIAKRKDNIKIVIPCLVDGKLVQAAIKRIRTFKKVKGKETDGTTRKQLQRATNKFMKDFTNDSLKFHDTRRIYMQWCVENIHRKDASFDYYNLNHRDFTQAVLGHSEGNSGRHYEDFITINY